MKYFLSLLLVFLCLQPAAFACKANIDSDRRVLVLSGNECVDSIKGAIQPNSFEARDQQRTVLEIVYSNQASDSDLQAIEADINQNFYRAERDGNKIRLIQLGQN